MGLKELYLDSARSILMQLEKNLNILKKDFSDENLKKETARLCHTFKGNSMQFKQFYLGYVAGTIEMMINKEFDVDEDLQFYFVFDFFDMLKEFVENFANNIPETSMFKKSNKWCKEEYEYLSEELMKSVSSKRC
jgi:chemotaxis protein histidine kinase CheA